MTAPKGYQFVTRFWETAWGKMTAPPGRAFLLGSGRVVSVVGACVRFRLLRRMG